MYQILDLVFLGTKVLVIGRQKVYRKHRGDEGKVNPVDLEAVREYLHKDQQNGKDRLEGHSKW